MVHKRHFNHVDMVFLEHADLLDILYTVRNKIHAGHGLLSHPLSGSVKPGQTPYKSVMITKDQQALDPEALKIIENSIEIAENQINRNRAQAGDIPEKLLEDFQLVDLDLITSGMDQ